MTQSGHADFDFSSMEGFLSARILVEGLRRAGRGLTRDGLVASLETLRNFDMGGFTVNYTPESHEGSRYTDLTLISKGGRFVR
jgi:hypothetical protein